MHELSLTETMVAIATQQAQGARVHRITLTIGQLSGVLPDAIRFCFDVCAQGTPLEGATLIILAPPGIGRCRDCGRQLPLDQPFGICDCGSPHLDIIQGRELTIQSLEVDDLCA